MTLGRDGSSVLGGQAPRTRFLVELAEGTGVLSAIQGLADQARDAAEEAAMSGLHVRFLRLVFVPEDGACFLLFEAESEEAVRRAVAGRIGVGRIDRSLEVEPVQVPGADFANLAAGSAEGLTQGSPGLETSGCELPG